MFPVSCDGAVTMFDNWVMVSGASVLAVFTMMVAVLFRGSLFSLFVVKVTSAFPVPSVWLKVIHVGRFSKVQVSSEEMVTVAELCAPPAKVISFLFKERWLVQFVQIRTRWCFRK